MAVGDRVDLAPLGDLGEFRRPAVLPAAGRAQARTAFLSQTGMNSTMEALLYQVPLAAFPQTPEQTANARRVQELGFGRLIDTNQLSPELLRQTVDEVAAAPASRPTSSPWPNSCAGQVARSPEADAIEAYLN